MRQISVIELQSDVASWIRQAAVEKQIVITDHGQPVAALVSFLLTKPTRPLPYREERIGRRSFISVDSGVYISEMRD
ncbi:MAG: type II toxin-antitoxin system Phd/YefM family antitoxin [Blastocatellia bacterium]